MERAPARDELIMSLIESVQERKVRVENPFCPGYNVDTVLNISYHPSYDAIKPLIICYQLIILLMSRFIGILSLILIASSFRIQTIFSAFSALSKAHTEVSDVNWPFTVVSKGSWTPTALSLKQTPARNTNNAITMRGTSNGDIDFSKVDVNVKLNGLFLHSESVGYTEAFEEGDRIEFNYSNFIPSFAPAGTYLITFSFKESNGKQNGVWSMTFKL